MAKRIHNPKTKIYIATRERSTSAGKKGTFMGKWSPNLGSAQAKAGSMGTAKAIKHYGRTLRWLGSED